MPPSGLRVRKRVHVFVTDLNLPLKMNCNNVGGPLTSRFVILSDPVPNEQIAAKLLDLSTD